MMKNNFLWVVLIAAAAMAQEKRPAGYDAQQNLNSVGIGGLTVVRSFDSRYEGIHGSPYLLPYWCEATVQLADGKGQATVPLKLDVYANRLEARRPQGDSVILAPASVGSLVLNDVIHNRRRLFKRYSGVSDPALAQEFFEVLYEGKAALLMRHDCNLVKASYQGGYNAVRPYDELIPDRSYYLRKPDGTMVKLKLGKKAVLEQINTDQKLKQWMEQEKLDLRREADVIRLLEASERQ